MSPARLSPSSRTPLLGSSPLRTGRDSLPSSRTGLLPSSPLRTVRESFQSHGSGPANTISERGGALFTPAALFAHDGGAWSLPYPLKGASSIFRSPVMTTLKRFCICSPYYSPLTFAAAMLAATRFPRGSGANLAVAGFVVGTLSDKLLPSGHSS